MKEKVHIIINGSPILIGYASMMAPTAMREKNRIFKMLRLRSKIEEEEGDIFFFEYKNSDWFLLPEFGFINLDGPEELHEVYEQISHIGATTWDEFVEKVFRAYYWVG